MHAEFRLHVLVVFREAPVIDVIVTVAGTDISAAQVTDNGLPFPLRVTSTPSELWSTVRKTGPEDIWP